MTKSEVLIALDSLWEDYSYLIKERKNHINPSIFYSPNNLREEIVDFESKTAANILKEIVELRNLLDTYVGNH